MEELDHLNIIHVTGTKGKVSWLHSVSHFNFSPCNNTDIFLYLQWKSLFCTAGVINRLITCPCCVFGSSDGAPCLHFDNRHLSHFNIVLLLRNIWQEVCTHVLKRAFSGTHTYYSSFTRGTCVSFRGQHVLSLSRFWEVTGSALDFTGEDIFARSDTHLHFIPSQLASFAPPLKPYTLFIF